MRRVRVGSFVIAVALAAAGATTALASAAAAGAPAPELRLVAQRPRVVVRGVRFLPRERVTVTVVGARVVTGTATAAADGSFRSSLLRPAPLSCGRLLVRAAGARGSSAFLRLGPPECNPAGADAAAGNR